MVAGPTRSQWSRLKQRRRPLLICLVLAIYALALIAWTRSPAQHRVALPNVGSAPTSTGAASSGAESSSSARGSTPSKTPARGAAGLPNLPILPQSTDARNAGLPQHSIVLTATSDAALLRIGYRIARGNPSEHIASNIASPMRVVTVGYGYGLMAALGVQASPNATYVTCSIAIDGVIHSTRTTHGAWTVAVCVA